MSYPLENALFQWEEGWRALQALDDPRDAPPRRPRRRGDPGRAAAADRADLHAPPSWPTSTARGTDWCLQVAIDVAPAAEGDAQSLADAAFWLYLRGASDFAGGRQLLV